MLRLGHLLIVGIYIALPALVLGRAMFLSVLYGRRAALRRFWFTWFGGLMIGITVCGVTALAQHGRVSFWQVSLAVYFATSLLLLLKGFDWLLWRFARRVLRLSTGSGPAWWYAMRAGGAVLLRALVLFGVGLPYVLAASLTYRPRVQSTGDPQTLFHWNFETIKFPAIDGTHLVGWWIPASDGIASRTVLLCHGMGGSKASQLSLVRRLVPGGYNVVAFDFRASGGSGGQLTTFGDLERRDVLGAVRWLIENHPEACEKVVGIGASTGAAALVAAAVEPGQYGKQINVLAVYGSFDRLDLVAADIIDQYIPSPMNWCVKHIGLPLASLQVGTNLQTFAPAELVKSLWPRPILVIHALNDELIDFEHGQDLYDAAFQPKYKDWIDRGGHEDAINSDAAAKFVKRYFDSANSWL
jgi:fermentation-respiration switch protein FrsA (DUF1100 family)